MHAHCMWETRLWILESSVYIFNYCALSKMGNASMTGSSHTQADVTSGFDLPFKAITIQGGGLKSENGSSL